MTMQDPIADMLTMFETDNQSLLLFQCHLESEGRSRPRLKEEGYIEDFSTADNDSGQKQLQWSQISTGVCY